MSIPSVSITENVSGNVVQPVGSGNTPLILGTCSAGPYGGLVAVAGTPANVQAALGYGPAADKAALDLAYGADEVLVWPMFSGSVYSGAVGGGTAAIGSVQFTGTGTAVVAFEGVSGLYTPVIKITTSSATGTTHGSADYSLDGGVTYSGTPFSITATTQALGSSGITAVFSSDAETTGLFVAGDIYAAGEVGTSTGTVAVSGSPVAPYGNQQGSTGVYNGVVVQITTSSDATHPGYFNYSLNGGQTYSAPQVIPAGLTFTIPNTGLTLTFSAQEGSGVWVSGDTFRSFITQASVGQMWPYGSNSFSIQQTGANGVVAASKGEGTFSNHAGNPIDSFSVIIEITASGTYESGNAKYIFSVDGGLTFSPPQVLSQHITLGNTGIALTAADSGGVGGTSGFIAGDFYNFQTLGPQFTVTDVANVLNILQGNPNTWGWVYVALFSNTISTSATAGFSMSGLFTQLDTTANAWFVADRFRALMFMEAPVDTQSSSIDAALEAESPSLASNFVSVGAGTEAVISPITGYQVSRGANWLASARCCAAPLGQDLADVQAGALIGVSQIFRNENITPGLDAARYTTLRTINELSGFYLTNGNIMAASGSDITLVQYRRVLSEACADAYAYLAELLNSSVRVTPAGTIDPRDAANIESGCSAAIMSQLNGQISSLQVQVDLTHDISLDGELPVTITIQPLGYLKQIKVTIGFTNSALQALAA
jgi:hypothetical protein